MPTIFSQSSRFLFLALIISSLNQTPAQAAVFQINSQTRAVTAYQGMAMVTREVSLPEISAGLHIIQVKNLPGGMNQDSLSIRGGGSAQIKIRHTQLLPDPDMNEPAEMKSLRKKISELERALIQARNTQELNQVHKNIMEQFEQILEDKSASDKAKTNFQVKDWEAMVRFTLDHHAEILESERSTASLKIELQESLSKLKKDLQKWLEANQTKLQAEIHVLVEKPGDATLQLKYLIGGVSWNPAYEAHLSQENKKIKLIYLGDLSQKTGESWDRVELSLSSATPVLNMRPPSPQIWSVGPIQMPLAKGRVMEQRMADEAPMPAAAIPVSNAVNYLQSEVADSGLSIRFQLPGEQNITSSQDARRLSMATREIDCDTAYKIIPRQSQLAFLEAKIKNSTGLPLLPGSLRTFVFDEFTGTTGTDLIRPGEESRISFGVDRDIRVNWREKERKQTAAGMLGDIEQIEVTYEAEVTNYKKIPVQLRILEPAPRATDEKIKIELIQSDPEATTIDDNGLRTWLLEAQPWEKKTIRLSYRIRHPKEMQIHF